MTVHYRATHSTRPVGSAMQQKGQAGAGALVGQTRGCDAKPCPKLARAGRERMGCRGAANCAADHQRHAQVTGRRIIRGTLR